MRLFAKCVNRVAKYWTKFNNTLRGVAELNPTLGWVASGPDVAKIAQAGFCCHSAVIVKLLITRMGAPEIQ